MKIEITTSPRNVELANFLLSQAIDLFEQNPKYMKEASVSGKDLILAERFRKSLLKGFLK